MRIPDIGQAGGADAGMAHAPGRRTGESSLVGITLPRQGERTLRSVYNMLSAFSDIGSFSLEIAGDSDGARLMARCAGMRASSFRRSLVGYYPQSRIEEIQPLDDPLTLGPNERAWTRSLRVGGSELLPLHAFDDDLSVPGTDPILGILGSMSSLGEGERVVSRLILSGKPHGWSEQYMGHAMSGAGSHNQLALDEEREREKTAQARGGGIVLIPLAAAAIVGVNVYQAWISGDELRAILYAGGSLLGSAALGYGYFRFLRPKKAVYLDPRLVEKRVSGAAFDAEVRVCVFQGPLGGASRARDIMEDVTAAYSHYDNPLGSRFEAGEMEEASEAELTALELDGSVQEVPTGLAAFKTFLPSRSVSPSILGALEAASLWHPPAAEDDIHPMERMTSRFLLPRYHRVDDGAFVGTNDAGYPVLLPAEALRSHQFFVARTRMGKSTMMRHIVEHKMREKARGNDDDAIVVIDPHSDLVHGLMELCPPEIADKVRVIDLGDPERSPGINLLDAHVFQDRDLTCDGIVRVAKGLWDNWGSRMQNILEHLAKSMHEANALRGDDRDGQYTLLDGHDMLSSNADGGRARRKLLSEIEDPYLLRWWKSEFGGWDNRMRVEACAPVQTRLAYYASSLRARRVIGQPRSTLDIREVIQSGGILLVATSQAYVGRDVASLLGACILNLVDAVIRNQGTLAPEERRGCQVVVDEMQSIPGVDYEGMLSEVGKFGGSLTLATQSLTKLDELSPTMRDTILANTGCLCVFQVSAQDAQRLRGELGADRVEEHDIVSLPRHECYLKMSGLPGGVSTMSMRVRPPTEGDSRSLSRILAGIPEYTMPVERIDETLSARVGSVVGRPDDGFALSVGESGCVGDEDGEAGESLASRARGSALRRRRAERAMVERGGGEGGSRKNSQSNV